MVKFQNSALAWILVWVLMAGGLTTVAPRTSSAVNRRSTMILYVASGRVTPVLQQFGSALLTGLDGVRQVKTPGPAASNMASSLPMTPGDELLADAGKTYMDFDAELAMQQIDQAIYLLGRDPGSRGSLIESWLFKAQILIEKGRSHDATLALEEAAALNLSMTDLDAFNHSSQLRGHYRRAYQDFIAKNQIDEMTVQVSGGTVPVYVNGVLRGTGPELVIRFPKGRTQILRAGGNLKSRKVVTADRNVALIGRVTAPEKNQAGSADLPLIRPAPLRALVTQVLQRAQDSGADEVILLEAGRDNGQKRITVVVVDAASGRVSHPLVLETDGGEAGMQGMIGQAENYLRTLSPEAFAEVDTLSGVAAGGGKSAQKSKNKKSDGGENSGKPKSFFASPAGIAIIGVLVAGAGVGAAFALGGGGGGSSGSTAGTTTVTISGPAPSVLSTGSP